MADKITLENVKVGKDGVELKVSSQGKEYAQFTAMWSSGRKGQNGQREYGPTKFVKVMVFGFKAGDLVAGVRAGDLVNVAGSVEHFEWQSNNGPRDDWSIFAESVTLPVPRAQQGQQGWNNQQQPQQQPATGGFGQAQQNVQQGLGGQQAQGDPWNSAPQGGSAGSPDDEPPF